MPASAIKPDLLRALLAQARAEEEEKAPISEQQPISGVQVISGDRFVGNDERRAFLDEPVDATTVNKLFLANARDALPTSEHYTYYQLFLDVYRSEGNVDDVIAAFKHLLDALEAIPKVQVFRLGEPSEMDARSKLEAQLALYKRCEELGEEARAQLRLPHNIEVGDDRDWEIEQMLTARVRPQIVDLIKTLRGPKKSRGGNNSGNAAPSGGFLPPAAVGGGGVAARPALDYAGTMDASAAVACRASFVPPATVATSAMVYATPMLP